MAKYNRLLLCGIFFLLMPAACSVMPSTLQKKALPQMPLDKLVAETGRYIGETVILGGYVLEVINEKEVTRLICLASPLGMGQEPKSKDQSQGRLLLTYDGFLDPEVYTKDRKITVAGTLQASSATEKNTHPFPYVRLQVETIHLWPVEKPIPPDVYWDTWYYYSPWGWRNPYWW